jgi:MarR family transcriptional regulator, organic hydroperoxide resistance regulator
MVGTSKKTARHKATGHAKASPPVLWRRAPGFAREMPPPAEAIGFLVRIVQLQFFQLFYRRFETAGISLGALIILGAIHANPGVRHGVLADSLMIKRPNFTKTINRLQAARLIARDAAPGDKRSTALFISKKGERKLQEMQAAILRHHQTIMAALSPEEEQTLLMLLRKLSSHLRLLLGEDPPVL